MQVYVSFVDKEPNFNSCDASFISPDKFTIVAPLKQKKFEHSNIYISLYSVTGSSVAIRFNFVDPNQFRKQRNKEKKPQDLDWDEDPTKDPFYHLL